MAPTRIETLTLAVLSDEPLHGYGISQALEERTDGRVRIRPGNLYRVLDRLVERRLVTPTEAPDDAGDGHGGRDGGGRRRYYEITERGREVAAAELGMLARLYEDAEGLRTGEASA